MSNFDSHQQLLSEALRPKVISDLAVSNEIVSALEKFIKRGSIPNLLLYGAPGSGKTSAAKIIAENFDTYFVNGSDQRQQSSMLSGIIHFASTVSLAGLPKVCLIDEGDYLAKETQAALKVPIEKFSSHCRFIFTANDRTKLSDAIQSRLTSIHFTVPFTERDEIIERYTAGLYEKLRLLNYEVETEWLKNRVKLRFPDFRAIANDIEFKSI